MKTLLKHILCALILFGILAPLSAMHAAAPANFETTELISTGLDAPAGFDIAPDGRIFIVEQGGAIKIYKDGALLAREFDELPALASGDRGLLGIAFDPEFETNHYVYFYYVDSSDGMNKVVRFDAEDDIGRDGPILIYSSGHIAGNNHAGGTIRFGPDGKLYLGIGDSGQSTNSQDLSNPLGKILRLNKDGTIPEDNPFVGDPDARPEIWAYGFRNPFRFQFDSATGDLYVGDVGEATWEEINRVERGGNYGWPAAEGICEGCGHIDPIYVYHHDVPGQSVVGGPVYRSDAFPPFYQGRLFIADYARQFIRTIGFDGSGSVTDAEDFDPDAGAVVDLKVGPAGELYYLTIFPGRFYKVEYNPGNKAPIAEASASATSGAEPLTVAFSSAGSSDPEGSPLSYLWRASDGQTSAEADPSFTFAERGIVEVRLAVSDGSRTSTSSPIEIQVGAPPTLTVHEPLESHMYRAGDVIEYSASAVAHDGTPIPDGSITFEARLHHNVHYHPYQRQTAGGTGTLTIANTGEHSADTSYELAFTATDADGLTTTKVFDIHPIVTTIAFETEPAGLPITLNGQPLETPATIDSVVGFIHELDAPLAESDGIFYEFDRWSQGGGQKQSLATPEDGATYTAFFRPAEPLVGEFFANRTLSGDPVFRQDTNRIDFDWGGGSPDPSVPNDSFSARWSKTQDFQAGTYLFTVTVDDGARLYIDGAAVIDEWMDGGSRTFQEEIELAEGDHEIVFEYYEATGGAVAKVSWDFLEGGDPDPDPDPDPEPVEEDYLGEYFDNMDVLGDPLATRMDPKIDFEWDRGERPHPDVGDDRFSVRWTRVADFEEGPYRFTLTSDDGVRLYIDGELILNRWAARKPTTDVVEKAMSEGPHQIKIEYFERRGGAVARFDYEKMPPDDPIEVPDEDDFSAEYFDSIDLSGDPILTRQEFAIDHILEDGSPDPSIPDNDFSARWTKRYAFDSEGEHTFKVWSDDGVRLWIDDDLLIDNWNDHATMLDTATVNLPAGEHVLKLEYYENGGQATIVLEKSP